MLILGLNVFNEMGLLRHSLPALLRCYDAVVVVEGAAFSGPDGRAPEDRSMWDYMTKERLSIDGTTEFLQALASSEEKVHYYKSLDRPPELEAFLRRVSAAKRYRDMALTCNIPYFYATELFGEGHWYTPGDADFFIKDKTFSEAAGLIKNHPDLNEITAETIDFFQWPHVTAHWARTYPFLLRTSRNRCLHADWRRLRSLEGQPIRSKGISGRIYHYCLIKTDWELKFKMTQLGSPQAFGHHKTVKALLKDGCDLGKKVAKLPQGEREFVLKELSKYKLYNFDVLGDHPEATKGVPVVREWSQWFDKDRWQTYEVTP